MKNYAYLVYVDNLANHNKYYEIKENDDNSIDVKYGRVGGRASEHHYSSYEKSFYDLKISKERKGYTDVTALHSTVEKTTQRGDLQFKEIDDKEISELITNLVKSAREFVQQNYTIKANEITEKMVKEAQNDLNELVNMVNSNPNLTLWRFNEKLMDIFTDIPRKMKDVDMYIAKSTSDFNKIINREQTMIDNLKGQIMPQITTVKKDNEKTALEAYGLKVVPVTYKEEDEITTHLGRDYDKTGGARASNGIDVERRYIRAFKVENEKTRSDYEAFKEQNHISKRECRLFYHGSKTENWWSIMKQGLSLNPNASITGKMFGNGLYFAPDCRKALNYMDTKSSIWNDGQRESGYVAVYVVALGDCYTPTSSLPRTFNKNSLPSGCLSVFADKRLTNLKNDEYIVYDQAQCTIKYLVEMKDYHCRDLEFTIDRNALRNTMSQGVDTLIKIPNGVRAEIKLEDLMNDNRSNWAKVLIQNFEKNGMDIDRLYMDYNIKQDNFEFTIEGSNGITSTMPQNVGFTNDDSKFILREMKKCFAKSEVEWKEIVHNSEKEKVGTIIKGNNDSDKIKPNKSKQTIEKE